MSQETDEIVILEKYCNLLLNENGIRYVGIINNMGRQIAGRYHDEITPLVDEEEHKISLEHTMEVMLTKDLDDSLGPVEHIVTTRKKVSMITIPREKHSILISTERKIDTEKIIKKAFVFLPKNNI